MVASLELLKRMGPAALSALPTLCDLLESEFWLYPLAYAILLIYTFVSGYANARELCLHTAFPTYRV